MHLPRFYVHFTTPTESIFTSVLGKYRKVVGMSEFELKDVTDYFQIRDGRVAYRQFCKTVCSESGCIWLFYIDTMANTFAL